MGNNYRIRDADGANHPDWQRWSFQPCGTSLLVVDMEHPTT
jgi:hypothetical protein